MFLSCSFERLTTKKEVLNRKPVAMVGTQGCLLSQFCYSLDQGCGSLLKNWFVLTYMLELSKNENLATNMRESIFERSSYLPSLDRTELKKKKPAVRMQPGGDNDGHGSNDCLFPGLHYDAALDCLAWACRSDYGSLACLNKRFNMLIGSGYLYKLRRQRGIAEHWVYVACSLMPWEAFDPVRHRWMRLPRMPCDECFSYADKESLAVGTELLVFGREISGFAIWMYSLLTRNWSRCQGMNLPRCLFGSSSRGEIAIVAGGSDRNGRVLKLAELYNSELGTWETLPDMNFPRKLCSGFFMDGKFFVIGGMSSQTHSLTCGEEYNLETRTWRRIENMYPRGNRATQSPPLVAVVNNQLYAADQATNTVKNYNKASNTWSIVGSLPVRADSYNGWGLAFKACGDKLLVVGGHRGPEGEVILLQSWCPSESRGGPEWDVLAIKERAGAFVYNCAVMGC